MGMLLVVNPQSADGKTGKNWPATFEVLQSVTAGKLEHIFTESPGHATAITRTAIKDGYDTIVAVGGDGTVNEVVNGFFEDGALISSASKLAIISQGTGKDLIKTLGIPSEVEHAARVIVGNAVKKIDLGRASFPDHHGVPCRRLFINVGDLGFSGAVVERVNCSSKALGGFISYLSGLFTTLLTYRNKRVRLRIDDHIDETLVVNSVNVANGKYFGGGMCIAPEASPDDGVFEIAVIGDVTRRDVVGNVKRLYSGTLARHPLVSYYKGKVVTVESSERVLIDLDGEQPGTLPVTFELLPQALSILVPA